MLKRHIPAPERSDERDAGFTLVEVAVAMVIAVILMVGLTITVGNALRAVRHNRGAQQAVSLALERLEFTRSVPWDNLAMGDIVLPADPRLLSPTDRKLVGSTVDVPADELLVEDTTDGWVDTYRTEVFDEQTFQVSTYITEVNADLRRAVAIVEWTVADGDARVRHASTLISRVSSTS